MNISKWMISAIVVSGVVAGSACAQAVDEPPADATVTADGSVTAVEVTADGAAAVDETKAAVDRTASDGKSIVEKTVDKTKDIAISTGEKTKEIAVGVGSTTKDVVSTTGEVITDGWITTKVSAKFVDESLLKDSNINVDTDNRVVTLKGPVTSDAAKARAAAIARGTEGVASVVNEIVVRAR
jgi:hyperosmotically inducible periplasmic protein